MSSAFKFFSVQLVVLVLTASVVRAGGNTGLLYALFFDGSDVSAPPGRQGCLVVLSGRRRRPSPLRRAISRAALLEDRTLAPTPKGPQIFMSNGDVLPGKLAGFLPAATENDLPDRLVVAVGYPLLAADPHGMAIRADRIARITQIASSTVERPAGEPGSLLLTDGARLTVRADALVRRGPDNPHRARIDHGPVRRHRRFLPSSSEYDGGRVGRRLVSSPWAGVRCGTAGDRRWGSSHFPSRHDAGRVGPSAGVARLDQPQVGIRGHPAELVVDPAAGGRRCHPPRELSGGQRSAAFLVAGYECRRHNRAPPLALATERERRAERGWPAATSPSIWVWECTRAAKSRSTCRSGPSHLPRW